MFYSHTFLARKGPLGTVWCAAHLQKLKKSHYTSTDIPSTVDRIMFPEVPIALRMSGYLLFGVAKIYEKKVEYLLSDCNVILLRLRNAFISTDVNLPENATQAQFHAVTLPETFELDALELDDYMLIDVTEDNHLRSPEDITLVDQIPAERETYVAISFDDDFLPDVSHAEAPNQAGLEPRLEEIPSVDPEIDGDQPDVPEIEIQRHTYLYDQLPNVHMGPDSAKNAVESDRSPEEVVNDKDISTPVMKELLASVPESPQFQQPSEPSSFPEGAPEISGFHASFGNVSPAFALQPSPPAAENVPTASVQPAQVARRRQRKRRNQCFDTSVTLTNAFMNRSLEDCSDLVKKRKKLPGSTLDLWRLKIRKGREQVFQEPLLSGLCSDLQNVLKSDFISSNHHLLIPEQEQQEPSAMQSPEPVCNDDIETEQLRDGGYNDIPNPLADITPAAHSPLQSHGSEHVDFSTHNIGSVSEPSGMPTLDLAPSTDPFHSELGTPVTNLEERFHFDNSGLSNIPELQNSAEADELAFLEEDNNTPANSQGIRDGDIMSARTRAVAQYLLRHSPISQYPDGPSGDLSLNRILDGRSRKLCARMFFETLVLKSYGLVDVQQDECHGDITLKLTSSLSKSQI